MNTIITISRQFGSGGREVGKRLADALNIAYYDKELLAYLSKETGLSKEFINKYDEVATRNYGFTFRSTLLANYQTPTEQLQVAQTQLLKTLANKSDCVIVGRCADDILREYNPFKLFIYASDMDFRITRCFEKVPEDRGIKDEKGMRKEILAIDKQRKKYRELYTNNNWLDMTSYNLCIDTSVVGIKGAVEIISKALEIHQSQR